MSDTKRLRLFSSTAVLGNNYTSDVNTTMTATESFTGQWEECTQFGSVYVSQRANGCGGTLYLDWGVLLTGTTTITVMTTDNVSTVDGVTAELNHDVKFPYCRVRWDWDTTFTPTLLVVFTQFRKESVTVIPAPVTCSNMFIAASSVTVSAGITVYFSNSGFTSSFGGGLNEPEDVMLVTENCTVTKFAARIDLNGAGTANCTYWLRKNFARTAHSITFTANVPAYKEIIISEPMGVGDVFLFECVNNAGGASLYPKASISLIVS